MNGNFVNAKNNTPHFFGVKITQSIFLSSPGNLNDNYASFYILIMH